MKKYKFFIIMIIFLTLLLPIGVAAHFSGLSSVDGKEIRWVDYTSYDDSRNWSVDQWNALGKVNIAADVWYTAADLKWEDINDPDALFAAQWRHYAYFIDRIQFNSPHMNNLSTSEKRMVASHELGHALGLDHSYAGQLMEDTVSSITTPQSHDRDDYYELWD